MFSFLWQSTSFAQGKKKPSAEDRARKNLRRLPESKSLLWDFSTLRAFSYLQKDDVLPTLLKIYKKPPTTPRDHLRYLTATVIRQKFDRRRFLGSRYSRRQKPTDEDFKCLLQFASKDTTKDIHAWGAFNSFYLLSQYNKLDDSLLDIAKKDKGLMRRAALIEALGHCQSVQIVDLADKLMPKLVKLSKKYQRAVLLESLAWAVSRYCSQWYRPRPVIKKAAAKKKPVKKPAPAPNGGKKPVKPVKPAKPVKPVAKPTPKKASAEDLARKARATEILKLIIDQVDNKKSLDRTRREISLALQYCFGSSVAYEDPESWRGELLKKKSLQNKPATTMVRFMGIEDRGKRILFLLDGSDSMLTPLTAAERAALKDLLPKASAKKSVSRKSKRPWDNIKNRFDAARLHLQHTLLNMPSKVSFAVILFGDKAELLASTPGFMRASKRSSGVVMKTLWDIKIGATSTARPHGTLKGQTNIYQAFALAFKIGKRGVRKSAAPHIDKKLYFEGPETIYLLSDGKPTRDGFAGQSPKIKIGGYWLEPYEGVYTDPETGVKRTVKRPKRIFVPEREQQIRHVYGPYTQYDPLINELARMNMFRKVVIHVIGIGEVDRVLPKRIAELGRGRWIHVGSK
jgi:hypothetical protein